MAFRVACAAATGLAFGAYQRGIGQVEAKDTYIPSAVGTRKDYGVKSDEIALDVKQELEDARRLIREEDKAREKAGIVKAKGALTLKFQPLKLGEVINLTEETAIFRFLLPHADDEFNMEPCSTLQVQKKEGPMIVEQVQRMYTPITPNGAKGYFDILVKKQKHGRMTEILWGMKVGESLNFRIVLHKLKYMPNVYEHVGMIGAGSGITPLLQVIRAGLEDPKDKTKLSLLFANPSNRRVLLKGTLDALASQSNGRFKPYYTVDKVVDGDKWSGFVGWMDANMIRRTMPPPGKKNLILVCGSDQLMNNLCGVPLAVMKPWSSGAAMQPAAAHAAAMMGDDVGGVLGDLGYQAEHVYRF
jgi:cytochrome-b5 reductase